METSKGKANLPALIQETEESFFNTAIDNPKEGYIFT